MVIVDTSVFSLFLRRTQRLENRALDTFLDLYEKNQVSLLGTVYLELLSGVRYQTQFEKLADTLTGFPLTLATAQDHKTAAAYYNLCRQNGIQGSSVDFLICAQSVNQNAPILTLDADFAQYAAHIPIRLIPV